MNPLDKDAPPARKSLPGDLPFAQVNDCRKRVVVVGAGPTGLTIANVLGLAGIDVLLVERNVTTVQEPRAVSLHNQCDRQIGVKKKAGPDRERGASNSNVQAVARFPWNG